MAMNRFLFMQNMILTVALSLGTSVPKGSKMTKTADMNVIAQKKLKRLPLKFQETFGKIKIYRIFFGWTLHRKWTGNENKYEY